MSEFEFLMAIASVVIAIALTEIFGGWGDLLRTKISPQIDWLHLAWTVVVVMYAIQYWVGIWPYRDVYFNLIFQVWFLIVPTLFIVLVAYAITPNIDPDQELRLRDYYMSRRGPIFIGLAVFVTMAQMADLVILGSGFGNIGLYLIAILLIPAFSTSVLLHAAVLIPNLYFLLLNAFTPGAMIG